MTVGEWLAARTPRPPRALAGRIAVVMGDALALDHSRGAESLLAAGERLTADLLRLGTTTREAALDLLTADALVTYAFEAAAENPAGLVARASQAMAEIAELGAQTAGLPSA